MRQSVDVDVPAEFIAADGSLAARFVAEPDATGRMRVGMLPPSWPALRNGETVTLLRVPESEVPGAHRREVRRYADLAAGKLGLPRLDVRYFRPGTPEPRGEFPIRWTSPTDGGVPLGHTSRVVSPRTIWIAADLRGDVLPLVVFHEAAHLARATRLGQVEVNASAFAQSFLAELEGAA